MDQLTINRIGLMHPTLRESLIKEYIECNNLLPKGVRLRFAYTYRSVEEQNKLFAQRPKVTNAKGGQSIHNFGLAFDYVILLDKDNNGTFESIEWDLKSPYHKTVVDYFISKGWEWGGSWKSFKDYPHFQKAHGLTWQELQRRIKVGYIIIDNSIIYPKL